MKKLLKWLSVIVLTPILLFIILVILLYIPPIQNWVAQKVAAYASEETGMDISVGHVSLKFPLDLTVDDFLMIKPDSVTGVRDTIADVGQLVASVQFMPLLKGKVEVDALEFNRLKLYTNGFIASTRIKGELDRLYVESHGIDLKNDSVFVNTAQLENARLNVELSDTVPPDTTESDNRWRIALGELKISKSQVTIHMPGDTLQLSAYLGDTQATGGQFDLGRGEFKVNHFNLSDGAFCMDYNYEPQADGLDFNHLSLTQLHIKADSLYYSPDNTSIALRELSFKEKSGLELNHLSGDVRLDGDKLSVPAFELKTAESRLMADIEMDLNAFDSFQPGQMYARLDGYVGKNDLMRFAGGAMPREMARRWPNRPLTVNGMVRGNLSHLDARDLRLSLPGAFNIKTTGTVDHLDDTSRLAADLQLSGTTGDLGFVTAVLGPDVTNTVNIPNGIGLDGRVKINGDRYAADMIVKQGGGVLDADVSIDTRTMHYTADVKSKAFPLQNFLPKMGLSPFTGTVKANGEGFDIMSPKTRMQADAQITQFRYGDFSLDGMKVNADIRNGKINADIDSNNPMLTGIIKLNAFTSSKIMQATIACDLAHTDLYKMKLTDEPFVTGGCAYLDISTDMDDYYDIVGTVSDLRVKYKDEDMQLDEVALDVYLNRDTTHARIESGDLALRVDGRGGYEKILNQLTRFTDELSTQLEGKRIDQQLLRQKLPDADIYLNSGHDNILSKLLLREGLQFHSLNVDMTSSHVDGLNGMISVDTLRNDDLQLDEVRFRISTDDGGFKYNAQVKNGPDNPFYQFRAMVDGALIEDGSELNTRIYDAKDSLGVKLGLTASVKDSLLLVKLSDTRPVIGYKIFTANQDNYLSLRKGNRLSADLTLKADDGTALQLYTDDTNYEAQQDLTLSLHKLNLAEIAGAMPFLPDVAGILDGDFHIVKTDKNLTISSDMTVQKMVFEKNAFGDLGAEFVYMPNEDGSHYVDAVIHSNGLEVGNIVGTYSPEGQGNLAADFTLARMPLELLNGFMPDQILGFRGFAEGTLSINGPLSRPDINGELFLDSSYVMSLPYGMEMRIADDPVAIKHSKVLFENFQIFDQNKTPLELNGIFDFSNLDNMKMDMRMQARNFMVINAKKNPRSEAFGKAFINFNGRIQGPVDAFNMRGRVDVLGKTDLTYVLRDSPLTVDTRMDELVKFVDFTDSTQLVVERPPISGLNMDLTINIDEQARIMCDLNNDRHNYIDLTGGGELRMRYNSNDDLRLTGRYTLANGEMKYSLPVIPLKTFTIQDGSYIEFTGDPANPKLNITATEHVKSSVSSDGGIGRSVDFECGVIITKTLQDMGLEFIIQAPDDMPVTNQLNSMSVEDRGKLAVTMLTTGMYLADGNTTGLMNSALSSFLQSEINNITGNALRTLDLSIGVDNATDATGAMHTDYSFKFSKRFWNNRLRIEVGGKVSTGPDVANQNQSFFNNVTFEYRLSDTSNKYLKLFYDRSTYDWFEGEVGRFGGGFLWKRKLQHLKDIFNFKSDDTTDMPVMMQKRDTVAVDTLQRIMPVNDEK